MLKTISKPVYERGHVQVGLVQQHVDSGESLLTGGAEAQLHCVHEKNYPLYTLS